MSIPNASRLCASIVLFCAGQLVASVASAASQCNTLPQSNCATMADCVWVDSYQRKDGRSVAGHCKGRPRKKATPQAASGQVRLGKND